MGMATGYGSSARQAQVGEQVGSRYMGMATGYGSSA